MIDVRQVPPSIRQLKEYTDGAVLPKWKSITFRPGGGRGRPRKGMEARTFFDVSALDAFVQEGVRDRYRTIEVRFYGDCHVRPASWELCFEKLFLVVDDVVVYATTAKVEACS